MTHTTKLKGDPWQHDKIKALQKNHATQDMYELYGGSDNAKGVSTLPLLKTYERRLKNSKCTKDGNPLENDHGGAVWDIFRRQDVPKLIEFLSKHKNEFRHINDLPITSVSISIFPFSSQLL